MALSHIPLLGLNFKLLPEIARLENEENGLNTSFYFQGHWPFPRDKLMQGYAYILTHPGTVSLEQTD